MLFCLFPLFPRCSCRRLNIILLSKRPLFEGVKISLQENRHFLFLLLLDDTKKAKKKKKRKNARRFTHRDGPEWERRLGRAPGSVHVANQTVRFLFARSFSSRRVRACARGFRTSFSSSSSSGWGFLPVLWSRSDAREWGTKRTMRPEPRRARSNRVLTEYCLLTFETTTVTLPMPCTPD